MILKSSDDLKAWIMSGLFLCPYLKGFDAYLPASARCIFVHKNVLSALGTRGRLAGKDIKIELDFYLPG